jgi:5-methylcytosine-specific restriction endonuclease McrA
MLLQDYRCAMTGRVLTPATASIDHIVPLSRGGKHCPTNAQIIHAEVNAAKRNMTHEEFIAMCCEVADMARREGRVREFRAAN